MAADYTQERIRRVLIGLLASIARVLLRTGVTYSEFARLAKQAFVDAASDEYGVRNRPTNFSRVALMTGLSRKEVSRMRRSGPKAQEKPVIVTLPAAVLNAWHTHQKYSDREGNPKVLPFSGSGVTFSALVKSVTRDVPPGAMRQELLRVAAIRRVERSGLLPTRRFFVPDSADERIVVGLELGLRRLADTVEYNSSPNRRLPKFQRFVEGPTLFAENVPEIRRELERMLADFSTTVDDYLSKVGRRLEIDRPKARSRGKPIMTGIGLYYFDSRPKD
jgi:hypothetical protein